MSSALPAPTRCSTGMPSPTSEIACYSFGLEHSNHQVCLEKLLEVRDRAHDTKLLHRRLCRGGMMRTLSCVELDVQSRA